MTDSPFVVDESGARYRLAARLGRGGQGRVHALEGGRFAVKLLDDRSPARREALREQLAHVRRLDLAGLPIARPLALLRRPHVGYIMELLTGMQPLQRLIAPPRHTGSALAWYHETGGLRRRLRLLARIAEVLAAVHGKGLAYGDPSPHNVFVSEAVDAHEVRLIDADNLRFTSSPAASALHTPGYGAPELVRGIGSINTLTDAHGFAVMAFEALTLAHPLLGDAIRDGDPDAEFSALAGERPWIDHRSDASNRSSAGIAREAVLSPRLRELCEETFGPGLRDPQARPGLARWAEQLTVAAHSTVRCPSCRWTYYITQQRCPSCDAPPPRFVLALLHLWDPVIEGLLPGALDDRAPRTVAFAVLDEQDPLVLTRGLALGRDDAAPYIHLALRGDRIELTAEPGLGLELVDGITAPRLLGERPLSLRLAPGYNQPAVHFGAKDTLHRVLRFQLQPGGPR